MYLREPQVRPDDSHVAVASQEVVPGLEVHDLLEVGPGLVAGVEEASVVGAEHLLPPPVLLGRKLKLLGRHPATFSRQNRTFLVKTGFFLLN